MLTYLYTSLFDSPAQTLVNTVNTIGVMGKGVAKVFRERYPSMFVEYKALCDRDALAIGNLHLWKGDRWVLNFPTKTTWRRPSKIEYIEKGLKTFVENYEQMGIVSASFPPLGCGNGNLRWRDVRPVMERYLNSINIPIYVHSLHVGDEFVAEHEKPQSVPGTFKEFVRDLSAAILENKGAFSTARSEHFSAQLRGDEFVVTSEGGEVSTLALEEIENAWVILRDGMLSIDKMSDETLRIYDSYLFPILRHLPYVRSAAIARVGRDGNPPKVDALFLARRPDASKEARVTEPTQECLSL